MDVVLLEAAEPVLRDLAGAGLQAPRFGDDWLNDPEYAASMMWRADGSGSGLSVRRSAPLAERIVQAADQVQEWAIEGQLWGSAPTNWPHCPLHPDSHPSQPYVVGDRAVWICPMDRSEVALIGGYGLA